MNESALQINAFHAHELCFTYDATHNRRRLAYLSIII